MWIHAWIHGFEAAASAAVEWRDPGDTRGVPGPLQTLQPWEYQAPWSTDLVGKRENSLKPIGMVENDSIRCLCGEWRVMFWESWWPYAEALFEEGLVRDENGVKWVSDSECFFSYGWESGNCTVRIHGLSLQGNSCTYSLFCKRCCHYLNILFSLLYSFQLTYPPTQTTKNHPFWLWHTGTVLKNHDTSAYEAGSRV